MYVDPWTLPPECPTDLHQGPSRRTEPPRPKSNGYSQEEGSSRLAGVPIPTSHGAFAYGEQSTRSIKCSSTCSHQSMRIEFQQLDSTAVALCAVAGIACIACIRIYRLSQRACSGFTIVTCDLARHCVKVKSIHVMMLLKGMQFFLSSVP
jgi:hypothetical protein